MVDPRIIPPLSANELLLDRAVRHAIQLERFKAGEVRRVVSFLDRKLYPDLLGRLTTRLERIRVRGFDTGPHTTEQVRKMLVSLGLIVDRHLSVAYKAHRAQLFDLSASESRWQAASLGKALGPVQIETLLPAAATLRAVVTSRPFQGRLLRGWWSQHGRATKARIRQAVAIGIAEGEGTAAIVRRVREGVSISRRGAEGMVRTAVNHVTTHAKEAAYAANSDVIKGVAWVSTLDSRTTPICQSRDGNVYGIDTGPRPPAHIGCRSTTTPVLKSWRDLGIDLDEAPVGTRASMNGQVPASLTYGDWLKRQSKAIQEEALGVRKAQLFRSGQFSVKGFVSRAGRPLTLAELEAR
jgi:SPP1 gp7 family putative phage head morphogenesis protein